MPKPQAIKKTHTGGHGTLGTFAGVFTPSILTILGIILFRRMGFVVGSAGLSSALLMVLLANAISILTSISLSAIATNLRVKGGGDYYIISRTLGVEFGGAIGLVLFLAQSVSIAFYCVGFGEVVAGMVPSAHPELPRLIAAAAMLLLFLLAWLGADWATRFQYVVMAVLLAALVSFFAGGLESWSADRLEANWLPTKGAPGFWLVFAIFFPAVTGFTQGVSMSGDLKNAGRSLPLGTFLAVGLSALIYLAAAVVFAGSLPGETLASDYGAMGRVANVPWLIGAGVIAATLSSAMASFLGAPRILQAVARDRIFPWFHPFAEGVGPTQNPRRAVILAGVLAAVTVALGNLNAIAGVVSMFFLISYGLLNYATYYETRAASPSFRPRFKFFHKHVSLLGALACLGVMVAIHWTTGLLSVAILFAVYQYLKRTAGPARWADSTRSYLFQRIREQLFELDAGVEHPRDWRPQILALAGDDANREQILRFASWVEGRSGLTSAVYFLEKEEGDLRARYEEAVKKLRNQIRELEVPAFPLVVRTPDLKTGLDHLLQSYGVGPLHANILLLHWLEQAPGVADPAAERKYGRYLREALRLGRNLLILDTEPGEWARMLGRPPDQRRLDVWWWGGASSRLILLLAYLMTRTEAWRDATIRVLTQGSKQTEKAVERLETMLQEIRIEADSVVLERIDADIMVEQSADADLVFLPLWLKGSLPTDPFGQSPEGLLARLPVVALGLAAEDIELAPEADEGKPAEQAASADAAEHAEHAAGQTEKEAVRLAEAASDAFEKLTRMQEKAAEPDALAAARAEARDAQAAADHAAAVARQARIKAARARKKAEGA